MTDRYATLTVALDHDIRDDDAEHLVNAIKMMRGVADVSGHVNNMEVWTAHARIRREWGEKLHEVLKELMWGNKE